MKQGMTLTEMATEIERQTEAKMDFVADTGSLTMMPTRVGEEPDRTPMMAVADADSRLSDAFQINGRAHQQIGERTGIPKRYYDRMLDESPLLLMTNVNHWWHEKPERRMVRTLDGSARAFLSDGYQRRDNYDLMRFCMPALMQPQPGTQITPWEFHSQTLTPDNLYLKLIHMNAAAITSVRGVDDQVHAGIVIRNSEVGLGACAVEPMIWWKWCTNGCIRSKYSQRKVHFGKRQGGDDPVTLLLSDETKKLEDEAFFSKVRDVISHFANPEVFESMIGEISATTDREFAQGAKIEKGVEILGKEIGLTSDETEGVLRRLIDDASRYGLTQYGLLNAVTRVSQDAEEYERATELERASEKIIDLSPDQWRSISEAA